MDKWLNDFSAGLDDWDTGSFSLEKKKGKTQRKEWDIKPGHSEWPLSNYIHPPSSFYQPGTNGIYPENMTSFYVAPGEFGYFLDGKDFGFESLSFVLTNTQPGGGPPLHRHETEEAHVVTDGEVMYYLDGEKFKLKGPFVLRIPPGKPHTFLNVGDKPFHLIAVFPAEKLDITELGPNPS